MLEGIALAGLQRAQYTIVTEAAKVSLRSDPKELKLSLLLYLSWLFHVVEVRYTPTLKTQ